MCVLACLPIATEDFYKMDPGVLTEPERPRFYFVYKSNKDVSIQKKVKCYKWDNKDMHTECLSTFSFVFSWAFNIFVGSWH